MLECACVVYTHAQTCVYCMHDDLFMEITCVLVFFCISKMFTKFFFFFLVHCVSPVGKFSENELSEIFDMLSRE